MHKESTTPAFNTSSLEAIERDVFYANNVHEVSRDLDLMAFDFLRSSEADDYTVRNSIITSYSAIKKTLMVISIKKHPTLVDDVILKIDL